jgi:quercetin dioxygenase-like cupin family protein
MKKEIGKESLNTNAPLQKDGKSQHASLFTFDLPTLIEKLKHQDISTKGELNSMILFENHDKQIVLITLHDGTELKSFQSSDSITVQVIEGKIKFYTRKKSVTLKKNQLLTLYEKIKYTLISKEDTVVLLTIEKGVLYP